MKTKLALLVCAPFVWGQYCLAQAPVSSDDWKPATSNQEGRPFPQINAEGRVRARIIAPQANSVQLDIGGVKYPADQGRRWSMDWRIAATGRGLSLLSNGD